MLQPEMKTAKARMPRILVMLGVLAGSLSPAIAEEAPPSYEMMVIGNDAFGDLIVDGKYESAIRKNLRKKTYRDQFALKNNLCVAYTMAGQLEEATKACDSAITANRHAASPWAVRRHYTAWRAVAYSNRGVLRLVQGDRDAARSDFEQAAVLKDSLGQSRIDLTHLNSLDDTEAR